MQPMDLELCSFLLGVTDVLLYDELKKNYNALEEIHAEVLF
jgi:hypothetical protein